jgi:hypothetical protein
MGFSERRLLAKEAKKHTETVEGQLVDPCIQSNGEHTQHIS